MCLCVGHTGELCKTGRTDCLNRPYFPAELSVSECSVKRPSLPWLRPTRQRSSVTRFDPIGHSRGELDRSTANSLPVRLSSGLEMRSVEMRSDEMRWSEMRWVAWYELSLMRQMPRLPRSLHFELTDGRTIHLEIVAEGPKISNRIQPFQQTGFWWPPRYETVSRYCATPSLWLSTCYRSRTGRSIQQPEAVISALQLCRCTEPYRSQSMISY